MQIIFFDVLSCMQLIIVITSQIKHYPFMIYFVNHYNLTTHSFKKTLTALKSLFS